MRSLLWAVKGVVLVVILQLPFWSSKAEVTLIKKAAAAAKKSRQTSLSKKQIATIKRLGLPQRDFVQNSTSTEARLQLHKESHLERWGISEDGATVKHQYSVDDGKTWAKVPVSN